MVYRTVGMMDSALATIDKDSPEAIKETRRAIEEYAVECSIIKVAGSEMLDFVVDETVQIYGGYGFVEEYPAERAYRDSRVNRIFEGTNEINRLIITGWLMKRAMSGKLPLLSAIKRVMDELLGGPSMAESAEGSLAAERTLIANAKKAALVCAGAATQKYQQKLVDQQEIMGALADMIIEIYAAESCIVRAQKINTVQGEAAAASSAAFARLYTIGALDRLEAAAKSVIAAVAEGDALRTQMMILRRLLKRDPVNSFSLQRQIARVLLEQGKYTV
jgi:alkylation response protein AidB-like acyl-CoA dehydrogenase